MNSKKLLALSAIVLGGVLSSSAFATTAASHANVAKAVSFEAPVVAKIVSPTDLPRNYEGSTVMLSMTIDDKGQPSNIRVSGNDPKLTRCMVSAVSRWQFAPAKKNGVAVPSRIVLPVELAEERS